MLRCNSRAPAELGLARQDLPDGQKSGVGAAQRRAGRGAPFHESDMQSA